MFCNRCQGKAVLLHEGKLRPCEECGGMGIIHCCEGLQAQPETEVPQGNDFPAATAE